METDIVVSRPTSRSESPETVFDNDFGSDLEEENEEDEISVTSVPVTPIGETGNIDETPECLHNVTNYSEEKDARHMYVEDKVDTDSDLPAASHSGGAVENRPHDRSKTGCASDNQESDVAFKTKQRSYNRDMKTESLTNGWTFDEDDLLCVPLVSKTLTVDGKSATLERYRPGKGNKSVAKKLYRKRPGSSRLIYISPMTTIANIAKKYGYDLPTFLETSEFYGGLPYQLPCMQCYEKYGGKGGTGMDPMMDALSGEGTSSNGKCLKCGGQVQTMASFGRMVRQLKDIMEEKGLVPHDVYPDGNCLFAAIVDQLRVRGDFSFTANTLRQTAVNYLRKNPTTDDGTHLEMFITEEDTWETYLSRMSEDGEWGDHLILRALTNVLNMPIVIYGGTTGQSETILYPKALTNDKIFSEADDPALDVASCIYLGHVSESHYLSLRPKSWRQELNKDLHQRGTYSSSTPSKDSLAKCPVQHINFILRQVFRMDFIKTHGSEVLDIIVPSRLETTDCIFEMFGSQICQLNPSKVKIDKFGPDISAFFPSVKEEEKFDDCFQNSAYTVFNTPYDTNIVPTMASAKAADLIAENDTDIVGHVKLIPKHAKLWRGQTTPPQENTSYVKGFEVNFNWSEKTYPSKLSEDPLTLHLVMAFRCSWPDTAHQWPYRYRESGFPDEHTIQTIVGSGCHVIPLCLDSRMSDILDDPVHFMTTVDDHTWCYSFAAAEKEICRFLSSEQRQSFLIFKALVAVTLKDIPMPPSIVKSIFFYACENIEKLSWKSKPGECLLLLLKKIKECLKNRHVPHYFMGEKNLLDFIPDKIIEECYQRLDCVRLQPVVALFFLFDQLNIMSSEIGGFVEEVIENIKADAQTNTGLTIASDSLLPVCVELMNDLIFQENYQVAMLILQDIVEERGNTLETNGASLIKKVMWNSHIGYAWCFAFFVDIKHKTTLTRQVCEGYNSVHVTEVFGPECIDELPDTLVPECFRIDDGDLLFADKVSDILLYTVSGKMFIKCLKYYLNRYGELAGDLLVLQDVNSVIASGTVLGRKNSVMLTSSLLLSLQNVYVKLFNFCDQSNAVEEFREMMPRYTSIAESCGTRVTLSNIVYMWRCLGEDKKAAEARRKLGDGNGGRTFDKLVGSLFRDYELN